MADNLIFIDERGDKVAADIGLDTYQAAADKGLSLREHIAAICPTNNEKYGSAYAQFLEQCGIFVQDNREFGIRASTVGELLVGKEANGVVVKDGVPASRLLFPSVMLDVIEDKLQRDYTTNVTGLNSMVAINQAIQGDKWERPVLNFSRPEAARSAPIAQLSLPNVMLTITASDKSMRIPNSSIGMEISEQALKSTTLDLVGLAMARQASVEALERANGYILSLLNGDSDYGMVALASIAGKVKTALSLDAAATSGITQKAWLKWLTANSNFRTITHIVTDLDGAMAIENRTGKPTVQNDNPNSPRIDTLFTVVNPKWAPNVQVFITDDPAWPAKTIMGIDARTAIHRVNSLTAQYSAIETFVLKRSTALRVDKGELLYRLFDESFEVMTYA